ncbi:MAG: PEP-CTERM sorting domain-containing protein [Armatimonadota bacterium]
MKQSIKLILIGGVLIGSSNANAQSGPGANYYMTAGDQKQNWTAIGGTATSGVQATGGEYNIAVSGDLRTTGNFNYNFGQQYDLLMNSTGTTYAGSWEGLYDGTTDGSRNYTIDYGTGDVLSYNRNWQNSSLLFNAGAGQGLYLGITYDGAGGLWISRWNSDVVEHRSMTGSLLSSFNTGFSSITSLAMDWSDGTLWMGTQNTLGTFSQFSTTGTNLQNVTYSNMTSANTLGGEFNFNPVPEPASFAVLGLGALVLLRRRKSA